MSIRVKNNVFWVGKIDWELRKFHGDEYSTHRGSTYNSYLIKEEKTAIFELVNDGIKAMWNPDNENIAKCVEYGKLFAGSA